MAYLPDLAQVPCSDIMFNWKELTTWHVHILTHAYVHKTLGMSLFIFEFWVLFMFIKFFPMFSKFSAKGFKLVLISVLLLLFLRWVMVTI